MMFLNKPLELFFRHDFENMHPNIFSLAAQCHVNNLHVYFILYFIFDPYKNSDIKIPFRRTCKRTVCRQYVISGALEKNLIKVEETN